MIMFILLLLALLTILVYSIISIGIKGIVVTFIVIDAVICIELIKFIIKLFRTN